jgi:hypothetical protein
MIVKVSPYRDCEDVGEHGYAEEEQRCNQKLVLSHVAQAADSPSACLIECASGTCITQNAVASKRLWLFKGATLLRHPTAPKWDPCRSRQCSATQRG